MRVMPEPMRGMWGKWSMLSVPGVPGIPSVPGIPVFRVTSGLQTSGQYYAKLVII